MNQVNQSYMFTLDLLLVLASLDSMGSQDSQVKKINKVKTRKQASQVKAALLDTLGSLLKGELYEA